MLRPYQKEVYLEMIHKERYLNYLDMGLGKSLVTLLSVMSLKAFPCMIVCNKSAMYVLQDELAKWFEEPAIIYGGTPKQREKQWKEFATYDFKFIITSYRLSEELGQRFGLIDIKKKQGSSKSGNIVASTPPPGTTKWRVGSLVADEIQVGGLFNHKTQTYKIFKQLTKQIPVVYLLTGTPYRRGVIDFYGPLSLVDPNTFDSYWKYVGKYCVTINTGFGKSIERNPKNVVGFRAMLRQYASVLKKTDVLQDLPGKVRQAIQVPMNAEQERVYKELSAELMAFTDAGELLMTPGVLSLMIRQRQMLVAPQSIGLKHRGAAIDTLVEMTEPLVEGGKPFVVFTPFKTAVPYIREALRDEYPTLPTFEITGGLTAEDFGKQWQGFQGVPRNRAAALICVIKSGTSFHATVADTCFFLGYEWDFNQNEQAEDRLNRMGQKKLVTCYYMMHKGTIDEDVVQVLNDKKYGSELVLSNEEQFLKMLAKRQGK